MKKLLLLKLGLIVFTTGFAQDIVSISSYDFDKITDTIQFDNAIKDFKYLVKEKKYDEALLFADKLIDVGTELKDIDGVGHVHVYKAKVYSKTKNFLEAVSSFENAEANFKKTNNLWWLSEVYNARFVLEYNRGNIEKSTDYLLEAKMYSERLADSSILFRRYNNLGIVYGALKNNEEAEKFLSKAIEVSKKIGQVKNIGRVMNNLAVIYSSEKKFDKAKEVLKEALTRNKIDSLPAYVAHSYSIIAKVALREKDYTTAIKYYDTSSQILKTTTYPMLSADNKLQLANLFILTKRYKKAEGLLKESEKEFTALKATKSLLEVYKYFSQLDIARDNLTDALVWQQKYQKLSDERINELSTKKIERAEARYQAELEQLRKIDEQEKRELRTKEQLFRYRIFTFVVLCVLVISLVFLFWIIKTRRERKMLIANLNQSNQIKNKLFSIISHDLKNEIHGLEGSLNLMKENEISTEEFQEIIPLLANRTHQTSILLNNLLNWSKSQLKELSAKPVSFDVTEVITTKFAFFNSKATQKNIQLINKLDTTKIYADRDMVAIVAQNLIANAIKFCKPGDSIALISKEKEDHYEICFEDTGVGIDPSNLNKLFAEDTFTTNGTQNETGTGLGLRICKELIELNQGNIKVESTLGKGSVFSVSLPKAA
ncbi:tetratricopeptide repeat-containing sensor histidine kinase [Aquimarina sp. 2201CG14-23]|uniref:tetratricopeptide repeat-containing sensor histidine kinase n=1 Tax=Aquimarina mycalae TaxID=3040073 RepID=UPI0024781FDD|nr:ATP-binding protein [Aquimarina sp. 2201CG14-23]MDH7444209.1 tetratricopeptide repeat protein [Aquimarina sp. 2201CG14-23]